MAATWALVAAVLLLSVRWQPCGIPHRQRNRAPVQPALPLGHAGEEVVECQVGQGRWAGALPCQLPHVPHVLERQLRSKARLRGAGAAGVACWGGGGGGQATAEAAAGAGCRGAVRVDPQQDQPLINPARWQEQE